MPKIITNQNKKAMQCLTFLGKAMIDCGYSPQNSQYFLLNSLFCCFAEANHIFLGKPFTQCATVADSEQFTMLINRLFDSIPQFLPRVHYSEFSDDVRIALVELCRYDWAEVSPTLLGTIYLETMSEIEQTSSASFYTSIKNILNTINPLFLNSLKSQLAAAKSFEQLRALKSKLCRIKILDASCGTGNYLLVAFDELRKLEEQINQKLGLTTLEVSTEQFYGVEYLNTSAQLCRAGILLANRISEIRFAERTSSPIGYADLSLSDSIRCGNALRTDWNDIVPSNELSYIIGNPPFVSNPSPEQRKDIESVFGGYVSVDYCACWVRKSAEYIKGTNCEASLLCTNSICQGSQQPMLWKPLIEQFGVKINFAYQSFEWDTDLSRRVQNSCIIVGFANFDKPKKILYTQSPTGTFISRTVDRISCSLYPGDDLFIMSVTAPSDRPIIACGERLKFNVLSKKEVEKYPEKNFSKYITANDMLYDTVGYIQDLMAEQPQNYIVIPRHSSEKRIYIPIGFFENEQIVANDSVLYLKGPQVNLTLFGLLNSSMHNTWVRRICGRLMTRLRYSNTVYSSFPFPDMTAENEERISEMARQILNIRKNHNICLAKLYNHLPSDLVQAHKALDAYVEQLYEGKVYLSDDERMRILAERFNEKNSVEPETLGEKLRQLRLNKSLTLLLVESKTGIKLENIKAYELDSRNPPEAVLHKLAEFYEISVDDLLKYRNKK